MTAAGNPGNDRLLELLADRAVQGLSAPEAAELDRLLRELPGAEAEIEAIELAAAAADLAMMGEHPVAAIPPQLRAKLEKQAASWVESQRPSGYSPVIAGSIRPAASGGLGRMAGWLAAAACLALAAVAWFGRVGPGIPPTPDPASARSALLASAADAMRVPWIAAGELEGRTIGGDVVWSTAKQQGFMTFSGLPANDPTKEQYQLWIFDPAQSDKTPIDGGVFDVASTGGTVVVPIDPKLRVTDAVLFAITVEKPGGVVVSDRSRLILIAKPG